MTERTMIGLGWRIHSWWATVVALSGPAASPVVVHRGQVSMLDDEALREPYHAACAVPLADAPALIASVERAATDAAEAAIRELISSLVSVVAVGVVGGSRRLPADLSQRLAKHARLHEAERDLYERAVIEGADRVGLPITTIAATGALLAQASEALGVQLGPSLTTLGKAIGPPWQKEHKEAAAVALLALHQIE
jgi:gamma-glutamyl-gamma-aminobutyrate hydrolase PuuD